jgi:uncharacterized protein (DUF1697 family)
MTRHIAFLRAINVGGHIVKMDRLRALFKSLGLVNVETFIASGNVIFESGRAPDALEKRIGLHLFKALGYEVETFVRAESHLARIAAFKPFPVSQLDVPGNGLYIGFLGSKPGAAVRGRLRALCGDDDEFLVHDCELYWVRRGGFSDSKITGATLEKALGMRTTFRNVTTVRKLAAKYPG